MVTLPGGSALNVPGLCFTDHGRVVLYYARWLVIVLAAARECFQEKDLGAKLFPSCLLAFRYRCENLARLPHVSLRTAMSGGNLNQTGGVLASRVCFEPALFKDAHKKN